MNGKTFIQDVIPATTLCVVAWFLLKYWYFKAFPKNMAEHIKIDRASQKYTDTLKRAGRKPKKKKDAPKSSK